MSLECETISIIGYKIEKDKLYHDEGTYFSNDCMCASDKKGTYCSSCGRKMVIYRELKKPIIDYDIDDNEYCGYIIFDEHKNNTEDDNEYYGYIFDERKYNTEGEVYICLEYTKSDFSHQYRSTDTPKFVSKIDLDLDSLQSEKETFREKIELIESWDEEKFGIYNFFRTSY